MSPLPADLGDGAVLRRLTMDDLDEIWALVDVERPRLEPWMPWTEGTRTIDDQRQWLESVVRDERTLDGCGIFVDGRYVGGSVCAGIRSTCVARSATGSPPPTRDGAWSAVRCAHSSRWGSATSVSIGSRSARGVENTRSRAIPERLGFVPEGIERGGERGSNGFYDLVVYAILDDEWPPAS